jgi:hypothetical protein
VKKAKDDGGQLSLFDEPKPLCEAQAFYQPPDKWSNRLIAGDILLVMNSLLEKEGKSHYMLAPRVKWKYLFGQCRTLQYSITLSQYMLHSEGKT